MNQESRIKNKKSVILNPSTALKVNSVKDLDSSQASPGARRYLASPDQNDMMRAGFTLIELLVVIAIVGILAGLLMVNFIGVRQRARDGVRKSDLRQMQAALELYRSDNGAYIVRTSSPYRLNFTSGCPISMPLESGPVIYMQKIPCNPPGISWNAGSYFYRAPTGGPTYTLAACLENSADSGPDTTVFPPFPAAPCSSGKYYVLTNP